MADNQINIVSLLPRAIVGLFYFWFSVALASLVAQAFVGSKSLPSREWLAASEGYTFIFGLLGSVSCTLGSVNRIHASKVSSEFRKVAATLTAVIFGFYLGYLTPIVVYPMVSAAVAGSQVEHIHVVERADGGSTRRCGYSVTLRDLPFTFNRICDVPIPARAGLVAGDKIVLQGRGTSYGVFPERWWRLE